jgi:hypothetical protein
MESLINENLGLMADIFGIISPHLNIVDKVQVGLVNKGLNEIMKPIIKKDNVQVFQCCCFYRRSGIICKKADREENLDCMSKWQDIEEVIETLGLKNIVLYGCYVIEKNFNIRVENLVTNADINNISKNMILINKANISHIYEIMDIPNVIIYKIYKMLGMKDEKNKFIYFSRGKIYIKYQGNKKKNYKMKKIK